MTIIQSDKIINVADLGAVGNGQTDVTEILQGAIHSLQNTGGTVYIPAGTYITSQSLTIRGNGITILGDGIGATVIKLSNHLDYPIFGIVRTRFNTPNHYITVRDLTVDGNRENQDPEEKEHFGIYCGVLPDDARSDEAVAFYRVEARNCAGYGFDPHEVTTRLHIIDCLSHHNRLDGFTIDASFNVIVRGCKSYANDRHGFNIVTNTRQCTFSNNVVYENGRNGFMIQNGSRENLITNNVVFRNQAEGIVVISVPDNVIQNNHVYENGQYGIRIRGCPRTTIVSNRVNNNSQGEDGAFDEIHISDDGTTGSYDCMINNNHIAINARNRARYGIIESEGVDEAIQQNNMIAHNKAYGAVVENYRINGLNTSAFINA